MKYLLGPVSITAEMAWCPEPKKINFQKPLIDLSIKMQVWVWGHHVATFLQCAVEPEPVEPKLFWEGGAIFLKFWLWFHGSGAEIVFFVIIFSIFQSSGKIFEEILIIF